MAGALLWHSDFVMTHATCPAVLIAAPASGQGKTTVASALARLHARQGRRVRVFKCGPDFLDPGWLTLASGAPVHQLDLWMTGEDGCRAYLHAAAQEADLVIVEGVMGLFDGEPSAADLALRFDLPVLTVIDASAMAGTFGALAWGLQSYRDGLRFAGVLANRVGSARHSSMLQSGLKDPSQWLGALMRNDAIKLPERHLGLVVASEMGDAMQRLDAAADALAETALGRMSLEDLSAWSVDFEAPAVPLSAVPAQTLQGLTIAVARDAAFCFIYAANLDVLTSMGARLVFFSPLHDAAVPECDALWLPGGYPELHVSTLASNTSMKASLHAHVQAGRPIWAECGGMMALFDTLVAKDGVITPLWGVLPGQVTMHPRLAALGPQQLDMPGGTLRGHTFHYSTSDTPLAPVGRTQSPIRLDMPGEALLRSGPVQASYFHAWFPSCPAATAQLFLKEGA